MGKKSCNIAVLSEFGRYPLSIKVLVNTCLYTAQQKFSMDFIFVLILVQIRNDFFKVINMYGNP